MTFKYHTGSIKQDTRQNKNLNVTNLYYPHCIELQDIVF